ncbi:MAG: glycosyltransferase family 39 protein [Planctomycetota bacterium]
MSILYLVCHVVLGWALYRLLFLGKPESGHDGFRTLATSFGLGIGASFLIALIFSGSGESFWLGLGVWLAIPAGLMLGVAGFRRWRQRKVHANGHAKRSLDALEAVLVAMLIVLLGTILIQAVSEPLKSWDARAIYGTSAKVLYHEGGVHGDSIRNDDRIHYHRNYPLLIAYHEASIWRLVGNVSERQGKAIFPAFFIALIGLVYSLFRKRLGRLLGMLLVISFASPPFFAFYHDGGGVSGYADVPFAYFWAGAAAYLYLYLGSRDWRHIAIAAIFQTCAISTKNEGLLLTLPLTALLAGVLLMRAPDAPARLWRRLRPAAGFLGGVALLTLPWLLIRSTLPDYLDENYPKQILEQSFADTLDRLPKTLTLVFEEGFHYKDWGLVWLIYLAAPLLAWKLTDRRATLFFGGLAVMQIAIYVAVYLYSPHDLGWHIEVSWNRLLIHVLPIAALCCGIQLTALVSRRSDEEDSRAARDFHIVGTE